MAFISPSTSICYFQVKGAASLQDQHTELARQLADEGFRSIEQSAEELAVGWVEMADYDSSAFATRESCWIDTYLCFSFRQDRRRLPAALLKRQIARQSADFLAQNPTLKFVPKAEKEQIRERARGQLLARTLPTPSCCDVVWNTETGLVRFCSLGQNAIDAFQGLFHQSFPGLRLQLLHPLARAGKLASEALQPALQRADQAQTESVLEKIDANRWIGFDFLLWLSFRTLDSDSRYQVTTPGPLQLHQPFTAFLDNRLVLAGGGHEGIQKIVVAGPQDHYLEVKTALSQGKQIEEATIHLQLDEDQAWKLTLKGDRFQFGSYRTPMIRPDTDPDADPQAEAEAAFLTKLAAVQEGEQLFDSLLHDFLQVRLGQSWEETRQAIQTWLED
jgi:hypothetical protein